MVYIKNSSVRLDKKMNSSKSSIALLLFYVYRYYKRRDPVKCRRKLIIDMTHCLRVLKCMRDNSPVHLCIDSVDSLSSMMNSCGVSIELEIPPIYGDYENSEIVILMLELTKQIISYCKSPFYKRNSEKITRRLMAIHNLPRVLLAGPDDDSNCSMIHISAEEAIRIMNNYMSSDNS